MRGRKPDQCPDSTSHEVKTNPLLRRSTTILILTAGNIPREEVCLVPFCAFASGAGIPSESTDHDLLRLKPGAEATAIDPRGRKEGGWDSPGRHPFRAHTPPCGHGSCSVHRCPGRGRWVCVCSLCHSPGGRKMAVEGSSSAGPIQGRDHWVAGLGWAWGGGDS